MTPQPGLDLGDEETRIRRGVADLVELFNGTTELLEHLHIVDDAHARKQIMWLRRNRKDLWDTLRPAILESWKRCYPQAAMNREAAVRTARAMHAQWLEFQTRIQKRVRA